MASIERYELFLNDIRSIPSTELSLENKQILLSILDTPEMQARIPDEVLGDLSKNLSSIATSSKLTPSAILNQVTSIQENKIKDNLYRQENRGDTNGATSRNSSMESFLAAYVTATMVSQIQTKYPSLTQEEAAVFAASEAISTKFHELATPEEIATYDRATAKLAFTEEQLENLDKKTESIFESDETLSMDEFLSRAISSNRSAAEFFKEFDLSSPEDAIRASKLFVEKCNSGVVNSEEKIEYYAFLSHMEMYREIIKANKSSISKKQAQKYMQKYTYETGEDIYASVIEGKRNPESVVNARMAWSASLSIDELKDLAQGSKLDYKEIAESASTPDVAQLAKDKSKIVDEQIRVVREAAERFNISNVYDIVEAPIVEEFDLENYIENFGEEIPATPNPKKISDFAPNVESGDLSISSEEILNESDIKSTTHVPQETEEASFDIDDLNLTDVVYENEIPSEEITESVTEADDIEHNPNKEETKPGVEHDPDAGIDALTRGEKEIIKEPEEVVIDDKQNQPVTYNWRDVLRRFINRITGKTKAIAAPQQQKVEEEQPQEPPKGEEVKINDDSFLTRIAKALGMKKEEPMPDVQETKTGAEIATSASFQHVAVDIEKAVQETKQAKIQQKQNNGKQTPEKDEETQEQ